MVMFYQPFLISYACLKNAGCLLVKIENHVNFLQGTVFQKLE